MKLTYELTRADFRAAFRLHRRQKLLRRISIFIAPVAAIVLIGIALTSNPKSELFAESFAFGVGALVYAMLLPLARMRALQKAYRNQFSPARSSSETTLLLEQERLVKIIPGVAEYSYSWNAILSICQNENLALFYTSKNCFLIVPKRAVPLTQTAEFNAFISRLPVRSSQC